ncbi:MAG: DUF1415 domain-containing protein [Burkholderiaceae bacterium]
MASETDSAATDARRVEALAQTRQWVERAIVGLGLCPFAGPVLAAGRLRIVMAPGAGAENWLQTVAEQARALIMAAPAELETTLVVLPDPALAFEDFNDLLDPIEDLLASMALDDDIQIAVFHPQFRFAGTPDDDVQNCVHRAPWPTLHLLRRESLDIAPQRVSEIIERNERRLQELGINGWQALFDDR